MLSFLNGNVSVFKEICFSLLWEPSFCVGHFKERLWQKFLLLNVKFWSDCFPLTCRSWHPSRTDLLSWGSLVGSFAVLGTRSISSPASCPCALGWERMCWKHSMCACARSLHPERQYFNEVVFKWLFSTQFYFVNKMKWGKIKTKVKGNKAYCPEKLDDGFAYGVMYCDCLSSPRGHQWGRGRKSKEPFHLWS